jgi:hypothetical protein
MITCSIVIVRVCVCIDDAVAASAHCTSVMFVMPDIWMSM